MNIYRLTFHSGKYYTFINAFILSNYTYNVSNYQYRNYKYMDTLRVARLRILPQVYIKEVGGIRINLLYRLEKSSL